MRRILRLTTIAAAMSTLLVGCGVGMPVGEPRRQPPPCTSEFDIHAAPESLGSSPRFIAAATTAAQTPGLRITIAEVAQRAGWSDDWDHMLDVSDHMTDEEINTAAGTSRVCYHPYNESWGSGSESATGAYVFFRDGTPVQSAVWSADEGVFRLDSTRLPRLQPKTLELYSQPAASPMLFPVQDTAGP